MTDVTPTVTKDKQGRRFLDLTLATGVAGAIGAVMVVYTYYNNFLKPALVAKPQVIVTGTVENTALDYKLAQSQGQENTVRFYVKYGSLFYSLDYNPPAIKKRILHGCLESQVRVELGTGNSLPRLQNGDTITFKVDRSLVEVDDTTNPNIPCVNPMRSYSFDNILNPGVLEGKLTGYSTEITK